MGRKSKQELKQNQFLTKNEIVDYLNDSELDLDEINTETFAMSLYQFTKLIYDNIK